MLNSKEVRPGLLDFFGMYMQQSLESLNAFSLFFSRDRGIRRFLELGTGMGGLAILLGIAGKMKEFEVSTFTNRSLLLPEPLNSRVFDVYKYLSVEHVFGDIFTDSDDLIISKIQSPGITVLMCDGGNKVVEFNRFAPFLKSGDYILAHDYHESVEYFNAHKDELLWPNVEISWSDIKICCQLCNLSRVDVYGAFMEGNICAFIRE